MEPPCTYSTKAKPTDGNRTSECILGTKQRGHPGINILTVTKNKIKEMSLTG